MDITSSHSWIGLFFSFLVLISSIGCVSAPTKYQGRRRTLEGSTSHQSRRVGSSKEDDDERSPLIDPSAAKRVKRYDDKEKNPRRASSKLSQESQPLPDWLLEEDTLNTSTGPSPLKYVSADESANPLEEGTESHSRFHALHSSGEDYAFSRGYADAPGDSTPPLIKSHPCSGSYLEFIGNKLLILGLGLLIVFLQNLFMYPSIFSSLHIAIDQELDLFLYCLITTFVVPQRLSWIIYIFDVCLPSLHTTPPYLHAALLDAPPHRPLRQYSKVRRTCEAFITWSLDTNRSPSACL
jgi:hypothetical protein